MNASSRGGGRSSSPPPRGALAPLWPPSGEQRRTGAGLFGAPVGAGAKQQVRIEQCHMPRHRRGLKHDCKLGRARRERCVLLGMHSLRMVRTLACLLPTSPATLTAQRVHKHTHPGRRTGRAAVPVDAHIALINAPGSCWRGVNRPNGFSSWPYTHTLSVPAPARLLWPACVLLRTDTPTDALPL